MKTLLLAIIGSVFRGSHLLPHARLTGAITIIGGTGYQHGNELAQGGLNLESFECRYFPFINKKLEGITGEPIIRGISSKFSRDIKMSGEVNAGTGAMAYALATAITPANDVATFGDGSGTILLDDVTEQQNRSTWRSASFSLSSDPLVVAA